MSKEMGEAMFGLNLIMILILQEKDAVHGEIKYSALPMILNNSYMVYSNGNQLIEIYYKQTGNMQNMPVFAPSPNFLRPTSRINK